MIEQAVLDALTAVALAGHRDVSCAVLAQDLQREPAQVAAALERLRERGVVTQGPHAGTASRWDFTERSASCSTARVAASVLLVLRDRPRSSRTDIGRLIHESNARIDAALVSLQRDRLVVSAVSGQGVPGSAAGMVWVVAEPALMPQQHPAPQRPSHTQQRTATAAPRRHGPALGR